LTVPKLVEFTSINQKIINYSVARELAGICVISVLFVTKEDIDYRENLFLLSFNAQNAIGTLLSTKTNEAVQIAAYENWISASTQIKANTTVGGVLVLT